MQGIIRNYGPITQMYIFCPLTRTFNVDESRPLIVPSEYIQPVEVSTLEIFQNTKYNHKIYNLIQTHRTNSHQVVKSKRLSKHLNSFGLSYKLNTSPACFLNYLHHRTMFTIFSQMEFLPPMTFNKYN